jgi:hypothetical protein
MSSDRVIVFVSSRRYYVFNKYNLSTCAYVYVVRSRGSLAGLATQSQSVRVPAQSGNKRPQSMVSVMSSSSSGYSSLYSATAGLAVHKECVCEEGTDTCDLLDTTTPQPDDGEHYLSARFVLRSLCMVANFCIS